MFRLYIYDVTARVSYIDYHHRSSAVRAWRTNWANKIGWVGYWIEALTPK